MAHFQLADGTRLFAVGNAGLEKISIHIGAQITLEQLGTDDPRRYEYEIPKIISHVRKALSISVINVSDNKQSFTVKAQSSGTGFVTATDFSEKRRIAALNVVAGEFKNHLGLDIGLVADIGRGSDPVKINAIDRMLNNNEDNLFDQKADHNCDSKYGNMVCGIVCKNRGQQVFGDVSPIRYEEPYREPLTSVTKRSDVRYKAKTIFSVQTRIKGLLDKGIPVRVGVLDSPVNMSLVHHKLIAYYAWCILCSSSAATKRPPRSSTSILGVRGRT